MGLEALRSGNETGNTLWINQENMYIVDEEQVQNIYNKVNGLQANSFEGMTIIDPALDMGDKIIVDGKPVIYQGNLDFQGRFIANIKSKIALKQRQETTVKQVSQKVINRRVESNINQIEGKITQLVEENSETSEKLSLHEQTIDSMKDTLKSQETKIEDVKSTTDSNTKEIQTTTTKLTEVEKTVDGITQSVSSVETKIETVESTANTAKTTADATKQNLEQNYYTTTQTEAKIQEKAGEVTVETNKKIESIQIGGTNLLQDSAFPSESKKWNLKSSVSIDTTNKMNANNSIKMDCSGSNRLDCSKEYFADYKAGEKLTLSVWLMSPDVTKITANMNVWIGYRNASGTAITNNQLNVTPTMFMEAGNGNWFKVKITGNSTSSNATKCTFMCATNSTTGIVYVSSPKLERGTKDTDWSFADGDVVKDIELGQKIEANWEHVKVAWNTICEYLQLENLKGNASLVVRDGNGKLIMSLDKTGQHFWTQKNNQDKNIAETTLKDITINNQTKKALMFLLDNAEMNGEGIMAWGYKNENNVYPVLYVGNFDNEEFGLHLATDLIAHANAIKFQSASIDDDGAFLYLKSLGGFKFIDTENNTEMAQFFKDYGQYGFSIKADDFTIMDSSGQTPFLMMYTNEEGIKKLQSNIVIDVNEDIYANNLASMSNLKSMSGSTFMGNNGLCGMLYCKLKDGKEFSLVDLASASSSDEKLKENIQKTKLNALERIKQLNHVEFDWKLTKEHEEIGYIAQELEKIDKNYVVKIPNPQNDDVKYTVRELGILATTTKALQELNEKVEKQDKLIKLLLDKLNIGEEDMNA